MSVKRALVAVGVLGVVGVVFVGWWVWFRGDTPDAVSLDAAVEQLDQDLAGDSATDGPDADSDGDVEVPTDEGDEVTESNDGDDQSDTGAEPEVFSGFDGDVNGTWVVDDDIGEFDFETASGSFAGFRVDEELTVGDVVAVGRSGGVTGQLTIEDDVLVATEITVDMNAIVSNDSRRESSIRLAVGAREHPTATFVLAEPVPLPAGVADREPISVQATGELTINGITNPVTFSIDALIRDDGLGVVVGSTQLVWTDFDVVPQTAPIVVSIAEDGIVEFQLIVNRR